MSNLFDLAPQQWQALRRLLDRALAVPPAERHAWLATLDDAPAALLPRLRSLVALSASATLEQRSLATLPRLAIGPEDLADTTIGPYRLLRSLGSGGMADVWLAERTDLLRSRQVALKLPHGTWRRAGLVERLHREREILGSLEHPNIARIYDAGVTPLGQPWLALEYVEGQPLTDWCAAHGCTLRQRIELFLQVCDAVAYAHTRLVVHRDLKPSNIMVDARGQVKLLDFGIAKTLAAAGDGDGDGELTREAGRPLTPAYAAPEQRHGGPLGTAADIYSLGVVLFELLTSRRPFDGDAPADRVAPRPSELVHDKPSRRAMAGDIDTIVLRALRPEPQGRYATANAFADDLRRHLTGEPVLARPDSRAYRWSKFVRRHRLAVAASGAVFAALLTGGAVALHQARAALDERDRAERVRAFVVSLLVDTDPFQAGERPQTVPDLLRRARSRVATELASAPDLGVAMLITIGDSLRNRQQDADAALALDEAIALGQRALGAGHAQTLQARVSRLYLTRLIGPREGLREDLDRLVDDLARHDAPAGLRIDAYRLQAMLALEQGRLEDVMTPAARGLALAQAADKSRIGTAAPLVALAHEFAGQPDEALRVADFGLAALARSDDPGLRRPDALHLRGIRARAQNLAGDSAAAAAAMAQVVQDAVAHFGPTAREVGFHWRDLATLRLHAGDLPGAEAAAHEAVALFERWAVPGTPFLPETHARLGTILMQQGRHEAAIALLVPAFVTLRELQGDSHLRTRAAGEALALALTHTGAFDRADQVLAATARGNSTPTALHWRAQAELARRRGDEAVAQRHAAAALAALPARASPGQRALWLPPPR